MARLWKGHDSERARLWEGHDFSRAVTSRKTSRALAPEVRFSRHNGRIRNEGNA